MNVHDAFYKTVHGAPGGHAALAVRLGMSAAVLRNKANVNSSTNKPTLEDVDRIIGLTGDVSVLHALAANHGYICLEAAGADGASTRSILELVNQDVKCNARVIEDVTAALEDGRVDAGELAQIEDDVYNLAQAAHQLLAYCRSKRGQPLEVANG